jgi:hypothetical protein
LAPPRDNPARRESHSVPDRICRAARYSLCLPDGGKSTLKPAMKFSFNDGKPNASSYRWFKKLFSRP